jgi:hypothetical protein
MSSWNGRMISVPQNLLITVMISTFADSVCVTYIVKYGTYVVATNMRASYGESNDRPSCMLFKLKYKCHFVNYTYTVQIMRV